MTFPAEISAALSLAGRAAPGSSKGNYALPWYLVVGEPGSGRSTAIKTMNLAWPLGEGPHATGVGGAQLSIWVSAEAVLVEPESSVLGPTAAPGALRALCDALVAARPREPIDGVLLVISAAEIADKDERALQELAGRLRGYLGEVGRRMHADVPVYVLVTRYDTTWGFAEVFQWTPERRSEQPWGFVLPGDLASQQARARVDEELDGLAARFESFCLSRLSSDDPYEWRARAFQHLAEVRSLMTKLRTLFAALTVANAFERAPWFRALGIGSAVPGTGDRLRVGIGRFASMGLTQPPAAGTTQRPGGLAIHGFMKNVVLPERELVPLRMRWRDDGVLIALFVVAAVAWLAVIVTAVVLTLTA